MAPDQAGTPSAFTGNRLQPEYKRGLSEGEEETFYGLNKRTHVSLSSV